MTPYPNRLQKAYEEIAALKDEVAWVNSFRPAALQGGQHTVEFLLKERNRLKEQIKLASDALKKYGGSRSRHWRIADNGQEAREALEKIGE